MAALANNAVEITNMPEINPQIPRINIRPLKRL
jgi:hypothetical protein